MYGRYFGSAAPQGIAYPINMPASGAEVQVLQNALVALGLLDSSKKSGKYDKDTGLAVEKFVTDNGLTCPVPSGSGRGCKQVNQAIAQALQAALDAQNAPMQQITTQGVDPSKTCIEQSFGTGIMGALKGIAVGTGFLSNPCPPPGAGTLSTAESEAAALRAACSAYAAGAPTKIGMAALAGGLTGVLLGVGFAQNKGQGAAIGGVTLALFSAAAFWGIAPGKPDGC